MPCKGEYDTKIDTTDFVKFQSEQSDPTDQNGKCKVVESSFPHVQCSNVIRMSAIDDRVIHFSSNEICRKENFRSKKVWSSNKLHRESFL